MTKIEFCRKANIHTDDLSNEEYEIIEYVYARHPIIDCNNGKQQIADIYKLPGGMRIIRDMMATATKAEELSNRIFSIHHQIEELRLQMEELQTEYNNLKN